MNIMQILPFFSLLLVGCLSPTSPSTDILVSIDIEKALDNPDDILLSDFSMDSIEYIPLETTSESLVTGNFLKTIITDQYIIAFALRNTLLFERKTGKFIRVIAHAGPERNDYVHGAEKTAFDEQRQTITRGTVNGGGIEYDLEGNVVRKIQFSDNEEGSVSRSGYLIPLGEQGFAMYINNITGNEPVKFYMYDKDGNVTNIFQNHHSYEDIPGRVTAFGGVNSYSRKNDIYFYEEGVDTLYRMTTDTLIPYMHFQLGKYNPLYSERGTLYGPWENPKINKCISFIDINESDRFLFFSFFHDKKGRTYQRGEPRLLSKYVGFYDKQSGITKISEVDDTDTSPVINDSDGFAPLYPIIMHINQRGEMVTGMEAEGIVDWFEANPDKAQKLPKHIRALSKLKFDGNQVVVVIKLKK